MKILIGFIGSNSFGNNIFDISSENLSKLSMTSVSSYIKKELLLDGSVVGISKLEEKYHEPREYGVVICIRTVEGRIISFTVNIFTTKFDKDFMFDFEKDMQRKYGACKIVNIIDISKI